MNPTVVREVIAYMVFVGIMLSCAFISMWGLIIGTKYHVRYTIGLVGSLGIIIGSLVVFAGVVG